MLFSQAWAIYKYSKYFYPKAIKIIDLVCPQNFTGMVLLHSAFLDQMKLIEFY